MMRVTEIGELSLIESPNLLSYIPICNKTGGYVSEEYGGEFRLKEFVFSVAKMTTEVLTIPPYFINKTFCVMYGACLNELVINSYGGSTTELSYIKFTGESLDNLTGLLQQIKKQCYIACTTNNLDFNVEIKNYFTQNLLKVTFLSKRNKRNDPYFAAQFETLPSPYPLFTELLRDVQLNVPSNVVRIRSTATSELQSQTDDDASASASASASVSSSSNAKVFEPVFNDHDDYPF